MNTYEFIGKMVVILVILVIANWYLATYYTEEYNFLLQFVLELYEKKS